MTRPLHRPLWESYRFLLDDEPIYVGPPPPRSKRLWERPWGQVALFAAAIALTIAVVLAAGMEVRLP
jgi:predicted amidophosphoribosyltransferase